MPSLRDSYIYSTLTGTSVPGFPMPPLRGWILAAFVPPLSQKFSSPAHTPELAGVPSRSPTACVVGCILFAASRLQFGYQVQYFRIEFETVECMPELMVSARSSRSPRWYGIVVRVSLVTFIGTLLCFAVGLLVAILGTVIVSALRGVHPDMRIAYRLIALPMALVAGGIIFVLALVMEIRHYRQSKTLSAIERLG